MLYRTDLDNGGSVFPKFEKFSEVEVAITLEALRPAAQYRLDPVLLTHHLQHELVPHHLSGSSTRGHYTRGRTHDVVHTGSSTRGHTHEVIHTEPVARRHPVLTQGHQTDIHTGS